MGFGFFSRAGEPEQNRLYRALRRASGEALAKGAAAGADSRYVAFSRGCGGGTSFLVREEAVGGACRAYAILALYEESGIEESSFGSKTEALAFVARAIAALGRKGREPISRPADKVP